MRQEGFSMMELLIAVLIIGILGTIAMPLFQRQQANARNAKGIAAVNHALKAARAYFSDNDDSYAGFNSIQLNQMEASLSATERALPATPAAGMDPQRIFISQGDGTDTDPDDSSDPLIICSVSPGERSYCIRSLVNGNLFYESFTGSLDLADTTAANINDNSF